MRRLALLAVLVLAGCGGGRQAAPTVEGPFGQGAKQFWLAQPSGKPHAVVVLIHGLEPDTGLHFRPWLEHLAAEGDIAVYPRYESTPGDPDARDNIDAGVTAALARIANPKLPIVAIGHSRGARLAVEWAAVAKRQPAAVLALFPGLINPSFEPPTDLSRLHRGMRIVILVGDRDRRVGNAGAAELIQRLASFGAVGQIEPGIVHSTATLSATHLSPLQTGPGARKAFWDRADRLIEELSDRGDAGTK